MLLHRYTMRIKTLTNLTGIMVTTACKTEQEQHLLLCMAGHSLSHLNRDLVMQSLGQCSPQRVHNQDLISIIYFHLKVYLVMLYINI